VCLFPAWLQGKKITFQLALQLEQVVRRNGFPVASIKKCLKIIDNTAKLPSLKNLLRKVNHFEAKGGDLCMIIADWYPVDYCYLGPAPSKVDAHTLCKCTILADNFQMTEMMIAEVEQFWKANNYSYDDITIHMMMPDTGSVY
jgi:hypothetical protein